MARAQSVQSVPAPTLSLSANARTTGQSFQGWALIFDLALFHPQIFSTNVQVTPLLINEQSGSWANTIQLVVTDANGLQQNWPVQLAMTPAGSLSLDATTIGRLAWVVAPSDTAAIAAGTYHVVAQLNTSASAGTIGWNGMNNSSSVSLQITSPPAPLSTDQQEQQAELLARYDHLLGNDTQAVADLNAFLSGNPNNFGALAFVGNLLEQTGQTANALAAYDQALAAFYVANPGPLPEDPDTLLIPAGRLRSQLLSQSGQRGTPQVAIQLLDQGVQSPGVLFVDLNITNVGNDVAMNALIQQIAFNTAAGTGQVTLNSALTMLLPPIFVDFLAVNASATVRIYVNASSTVTSYSITETGTVADIFGTSAPFTETQTITVAGK
jgi:hypothetical protein